MKRCGRKRLYCAGIWWGHSASSVGGNVTVSVRAARWENSVAWWVLLGKRPMGRPRRRWEDNIKMDLQEVGGGCEDWMELAQDRDRWRALVGTVMNLRVPKMWGIS